MIKPRIIVTGATGKKGSVVVAEPLRVGYPLHTMVRREDGRSSQLKEKGRLRPNSTSLRPRTSRYCSISAQTGALRVQRKRL